MPVKEDLLLWDPVEDETFPGAIEVYADEGTVHAGTVRVEVIDGNVVITVEREDESRFGPVSLVVV